MEAHDGVMHDVMARRGRYHTTTSTRGTGVEADRVLTYNNQTEDMREEKAEQERMWKWKEEEEEEQFKSIVSGGNKQEEEEESCNFGVEEEAHAVSIE